jgi:hypothetical protein
VTVELSSKYLSVDAGTGTMNAIRLATTNADSHARSMKRLQKMLTGAKASSDQNTFRDGVVKRR